MINSAGGGGPGCDYRALKQITGMTVEGISGRARSIANLERLMFTLALRLFGRQRLRSAPRHNRYLTGMRKPSETTSIAQCLCGSECTTRLAPIAPSVTLPGCKTWLTRDKSTRQVESFESGILLLNMLLSISSTTRNHTDCNYPLMLAPGNPSPHN